MPCCWLVRKVRNQVAWKCKNENVGCNSVSVLHLEDMVMVFDAWQLEQWGIYCKMMGYGATKIY